MAAMVRMLTVWWYEILRKQQITNVLLDPIKRAFFPLASFLWGWNYRPLPELGHPARKWAGSPASLAVTLVSSPPELVPPYSSSVPYSYLFSTSFSAIIDHVLHMLPLVEFLQIPFLIGVPCEH